MRVVGISYGTPFPLVSDEESMIGGALKMLELRTLIPALEAEAFKILMYPPLIPYLYLMLITPFVFLLYIFSGFPSLAEFSPYIFNNIGVIWILSRAVSCIFGVATILVIYKISKKIFKNDLSVLMATILIGFEFFSVFLSHFARHWVVTVFFIWLTCMYAQKIYLDRKRYNYVLTGLFSGLGFATSYIGSLGLGAGIIAHFWFNKKNRDKNNLFIMLITFFLITIITALLYPGAIYRLFNSGVLPVNESKNIFGYIGALKYYFIILYHSNPVLFGLTLISMVTMLFLREYLWLLWGSFIIFGYILFLYLMMPLEDRYILPICPVLALLCGKLVENIMAIKYALSDKIKKAIIFILFSLSIYPACVSAKVAYLLSQNDTRILAKEWIENNIKEDTKIIVDLSHVKLNATLNALLEQDVILNGSLDIRDRNLLNSYRNKYDIRRYLSNPRYHTLNIDNNRIPVEFTEFNNEGNINLIDYILENQFEYIAISYRSDSYKQIWHDKVIEIAGEPLITFHPSKSGNIPPYLHSTTIINKGVHNLFSVKRFGPIVEIYKINY